MLCQLAEAETAFGGRFECDRPFKLPARFSRPPQSLLIPSNLVMVLGFDGSRRPGPSSQRLEDIERLLRLVAQPVAPGESERQAQFFEIAKGCTCSSRSAGRWGLRVSLWKNSCR